MRECFKCGQLLDDSEFYVRSDGGIRHVCKECILKRCSYVRHCKVTIDTGVAQYYWSEIKDLYDLVGQKNTSIIKLMKLTVNTI